MHCASSKKGYSMRIKSLTAENFKSLVNFDMELAQLTCLIGLNGAGKSTVLQFIDFVGQLVRGKMDNWLEERKWEAKELRSNKLTNRQTIRLIIGYKITFVNDDGQEWGTWEGIYNPSQAFCTFEKITTPDASLEVEKGHCKASGPPDKKIDEDIVFSYQGSILSQLKAERLPASIEELKQYCQQIVSLDLLSPELLRQRSRQSVGTMGLGGQRFSAFVGELSPPQKKKWRDALQQAYHNLKEVNVKSLRSGSKQLEITEEYGKTVMRTEARHINDGMLRLMAMLAELQSTHQFLLFDEIENGINPELIDFVLKQLQSTNKQVLITTHSPMILNYLDDNTAKSGVIYLYKTAEGETKSIPFFSIPSLAEKLKVMGPGEAFADTMLVDLAKEIATMPQEEK